MIDLCSKASRPLAVSIKPPIEGVPGILFVEAKCTVCEADLQRLLASKLRMNGSIHHLPVVSFGILWDTCVLIFTKRVLFLSDIYKCRILLQRK